MEQTLRGKAAVVTGVSRRSGIGYAIARRLVVRGASVFVHHYAAHDREQPWGGDDVAALMEELRAGLADGAGLAEASADLALETSPAELIGAAGEAFGHLDILVCNHARSGGDGDLADIDTAMLDGHWQVNARSTLMLTKHFAGQHDGRDGGRVVWLTSGQGLGPMRGEVAYAASKAALAGVTKTVADELVEQGVVLNTVNPGPVNTGYLDLETTDRDEAVLTKVLASFPQGRFGEPDDPARLVAWLVSDDARWVVGQVIDSEGGFRRW